MGRFNIKIKLQKKILWKNRKSVASSIITRENVVLKQQQINEALIYCNENKCRGWKALNTGRFPLIKNPKTINRRLDGVVINEKEREYCSIITIDEENQIVDHLKNKNRALQGMGRFELTRLIIHVLKVRKYGLKKFHGR